MTRPRAFASALGALLLTASLVGCATTDAEPSTAPPAATTDTAGGEVSETHNDADTSFAQMMIIHHEGAIEMAELAVDKAEAPEVVALAERIAAAQGPEIDEMTQWLGAWGEDVAASDHSGMSHGGMDMDGMSQEEMMEWLSGLSGDEFDTAFLEGMIAHHEGAVEMAEAELDEGQNAEALALAEKIIADQEAEIAEMKEMLGN
ncbi:DUF305 domain-containing protein [Tessaracoccus lubricantis]|uniref:DUF305 domain-containing protein n=1 Tax=Tessaracoccus lubricantis TaxID=545543 RepID=A0ABP9F966_9ACTN